MTFNEANTTSADLEREYFNNVLFARSALLRAFGPVLFIMGPIIILPRLFLTAEAPQPYITFFTDALYWLAVLGAFTCAAGIVHFGGRGFAHLRTALRIRRALHSRGQ